MSDQDKSDASSTKSKRSNDEKYYPYHNAFERNDRFDQMIIDRPPPAGAQEVALSDMSSDEMAELLRRTDNVPCTAFRQVIEREGTARGLNRSLGSVVTWLELGTYYTQQVRNNEQGKILSFIRDKQLFYGVLRVRDATAFGANDPNESKNAKTPFNESDDKLTKEIKKTQTAYTEARPRHVQGQREWEARQEEKLQANLRDAMEEPGRSSKSRSSDDPQIDRGIKKAYFTFVVEDSCNERRTHNNQHAPNVLSSTRQRCPRHSHRYH